MIDPGTNTKFRVKLSDVEDRIVNRTYSFKTEIHAVATDGVGKDYLSNTVTIG